MARNARFNQAGDLVPVLEAAQGDGECLRDLRKQLTDKLPASIAWKNAQLPLPGSWQELLGAPGFFCAVQLPDKVVGVLKVTTKGDCVLFLRLQYLEWHAYADNRKIPRTEARVLRRTLEPQDARTILRSARAFKNFRERNVHHPHVLSLLLPMSKRGWLDIMGPRCSPEKLKKAGSFTLVALPPMQAQIEQCMCLLGWSDVYAPSGDDAPLSALKLSPEIWGSMTYSDVVLSEHGYLFDALAADLAAHADPQIFSRCIPTLNAHAGKGEAAMLAVLRVLAARADPPQVEEVVEEEVPTTPPPRRADGSDDDADARRVAAEDAELDSVSEDSDEEDSSSSDSSGSSSSSNDDDAAASDDAASDDSDAGQPRAAKRARTASAEAEPAAAPEAVGDAQAIVAQARPCCERMKRLTRDHGFTLGAAHLARINADVALLQTSDSSAALVAAALSLATTLADLHTDRFEDDTGVVSRAEGKRVHAFATQARDYAQATHAGIDGAIHELRALAGRFETLRQSGDAVLRSVQGGGLFAGASAA